MQAHAIRLNVFERKRAAEVSAAITARLQTHGCDILREGSRVTMMAFVSPGEVHALLTERGAGDAGVDARITVTFADSDTPSEVAGALIDLANGLFHGGRAQR